MNGIAASSNFYFIIKKRERKEKALKIFLAAFL
jgi:hypothetical protein